MPDPNASVRDTPGDPDGSQPVSGNAIGPDAPIMEIMRTTRAMRHLAPEPVPADLLQTIIEAATWAPSGGNWQPAAFVVVTDRATMAALADLWGRVIDDFRLIAECAGLAGRPDASPRGAQASIDHLRAHFSETPALIVICEDPGAIGIGRGGLAVMWGLVRRGGFRRAFRLLFARPRFIRSEGASYYPAAENLLLAARAHGLAAGLTTWHLQAEEEFKRAIGIPRDVRTWAIIPVGYSKRPSTGTNGESTGPVAIRPLAAAQRRARALSAFCYRPRAPLCPLSTHEPRRPLAQR
jgi:nitroreductase